MLFSMLRYGRCLCAWLFISALLFSTRGADAAPQGTAGLTIGAAGTAREHRYWDETLFHLGARGDVLFGRDRNSNFGFGPYVEVGTNGFRSIQFGGGASVLFPVIDYLPLVLSFGAYGQKSDDGFGLSPGLSTGLFWGSRSYNFHGGYIMSAGLIGQFRYGLGASGETSIVLGAQLDFVAMSLPFLFLINAIRGGSSDTRPVR